MSKPLSFNELLVRSDKRIEADRARRIVGAAYDSMYAIVANERAALRRLQFEIDKSLDLSVSNQTTTVNRVMDLQPDDFLQKILQLKVDIKLAEVRMKVAEEMMAEFFSDFKDGELATPAAK